MKNVRELKALSGVLLLFHGVVVVTAWMPHDFWVLALLLIVIPAGLFWCIWNISRTNIFHLIMIALLGWAIRAEFDDADGDVAFLYAGWTAALTIVVLVLDMIFDSNIGFQTRKSFASILREGCAKVGLSLGCFILLLVMYTSRTVDTMGIFQLVLMGALHTAMLFALYCSWRLQEPGAAITWLILGGIWNLGSAIYSMQAGIGSLLATLIPAYWFFSASYKLRRCSFQKSFGVSEEEAPNPTVERTNTAL